MKSLSNYLAMSLHEGMSKSFRKQLQNLDASVKPSSSKKQKIGTTESKECIDIINTWGKLPPYKFWDIIFTQRNNPDPDAVEKLYADYADLLNNDEDKFYRAVELLNSVAFARGSGDKGYMVYPDNGNTAYKNLCNVINEHIDN